MDDWNRERERNSQILLHEQSPFLLSLNSCCHQIRFPYIYFPYLEMGGEMWKNIFPTCQLMHWIEWNLSKRQNSSLPFIGERLRSEGVITDHLVRSQRVFKYENIDPSQCINTSNSNARVIWDTIIIIIIYDSSCQENISLFPLVFGESFSYLSFWWFFKDKNHEDPFSGWTNFWHCQPLQSDEGWSGFSS